VTLDGTIAMRGRLDRAARRFQHRHPGVRVTVGASGDGSAIDLFCAGEIDVAAVARRLDGDERRACRSAGVAYAEVEVASAPIALVVSERNGFARHLTLDQAKAIWRPVDPATSWAQVDRALPPIPLEPIGWKPDSAPSTLLAEAIFGPHDPLLRSDYAVTDDAAELTEAVASSPNAIGYLPAAKLTRGSGVRPLRILPRPLYLDVSASSLRDPGTRRFLREYPDSPRLHRKFTRP
jgi:phosphate transport system substrate-binding protein